MASQDQLMPTTLTDDRLKRLRADLSGDLITPSDPDYDAARTVFYGNVENRPALIVRPRNAADIAQTIRLARETGLELAIRSGGHSGAAHSTTQGGILLNLSTMKGMEFDLDARTLWAESGLTAGEVTHAAAEHGLVIGFGDSGSVGIGGITLGGGIGFLVRKYGLTIDNLLAVELVTADGELLYVDADSHPDLFWALRGGGGNFGVVTRFKYQLQALPQAYGGLLFLPGTPEALYGFIEAAEAAPDELSTILNVMVAPPMPFIPQEHHGKLIMMAMMLYAGDPADAEQVIAPFRNLATPLADMLRPIQYPEMFFPDDEDAHPIDAIRNLFVDHFDQDSAAMVLERLQAATSGMAVAQLRVLGGASARVPQQATAYAHRQRRLMVNVAAIFEDINEVPLHEAWVSDFAARFDQGEAGVYVNFLSNEEESRLRAAYPDATWERLARVKAQYDPNNLFRRNHNIPPAQ